MKKRILFYALPAMSLFVLAAVVFVSEVYASVGVMVEGENVNFADQAPVVVDGRTLVPVRGVFEQLGFDVTWHDEAQQATLTRADFTVVINVGSATFTTNGEGYTLDVPAQIIGGRTMLPIRAVLESVGYYVGWDGANVLVSTEPLPEQAAPQAAAAPTPVTPAAPTGERPAYVTIGGQQVHTDRERIHFVRPEDSAHFVTADMIRLADPSELHLLAYFPNLRHIVIGAATVGGNRTFSIDDISPLAPLVNLQSLVITDTMVSDLTPLAGLTGLERLTLAGNPITDLSPLAGLTNLDELSVRNSQVTDITPLAGLTNLRLLDLNNNYISNVAPLAGLVNLTVTLRLNDNQITDPTPLAGLAHLPRLTGLNLSNNQITDVAPFMALLNRDTRYYSFPLEANAAGPFDVVDGQVVFTQRIRRVQGIEINLTGNPVADWSPAHAVDRTIFGIRPIPR